MAAERIHWQGVKGALMRSPVGLIRGTPMGLFPNNGHSFGGHLLDSLCPLNKKGTCLVPCMRKLIATQARGEKISDASPEIDLKR